MTAPTPLPRRRIGRELTRILNAPVADVLAELGGSAAASARRIGITGPPGGGKSTLISALAGHRLQRVASLAVLAIDPSSQLSGGSILGDRVRMDQIAEHPRLFIRSVPSRGADNGLCDNAVDLLAALEDHGFEEIILETVGVGQAELDVRSLVDTVVLVVPPGAGDAIQAMKSGITEVADVFAVTKADQRDARRVSAEIEAVLRTRRSVDGGWRPQVVLTAADGTGISALSEAIDAHAAWARQACDADDVRRRRRRHHLRGLFARRLDEVLAAEDGAPEEDLATSFRRVLARLSEHP